MSNTAEIQFQGTAAQLLAEYDKIKSKNQQLERDLKAVGQASKSANADQRQLARDAKQAIEQTLTPLEKYRKTTEQLKVALREGLLTQEQFNRANKQAHEEMTRAKEAADGLGRAAKKAFDETRTPLEKYVTRMRELREMLQKGKIDQDTFNRAAKQQDDVLKAAIPTLRDALGNVGKFAVEFAGIGTVAAGIAVAARVIKDEYDGLVQRQKQALAEQRPFGEAMRDLLVNFNEDETVSQAELGGKIQGIASRTGSSPTIVAQAAAQALSAGGANNQQALDAVEMAFRLSPNNLATGQQMSSRVLDLAKSGGDVKALFGFVQQLGQATEIANQAQLGDAAIPAISATMLRGDSYEQAGELFGTLNQMIGDQEGRNTRTAQINLAEQLAAALPELGSTMDRIAFLQANPRRAESFLADYHGEAIAQGSVEELIRGAPRAMRELSKARGLVGAVDPSAAEFFEAKVSGINADPSQAVNSFSRGVGTAVDLSQLGRTRDAQVAALRESLFTGEEAVAKQIDFPGASDMVTRQYLRVGFEAMAAAGKDPLEIGRSSVFQMQRASESSLFGGQPEEVKELLRRTAAAVESLANRPAASGPPGREHSRSN